MDQHQPSPVLVIGNGRLSYSVCVCVMQAAHPVTLITENKTAAEYGINELLEGVFNASCQKPDRRLLEIKDAPGDTAADYGVGIAITAEDLNEKIAAIRLLEKMVSRDAPIGINTESIPLNKLQEGCNNPGRLMGLNWSEPVHTTYFLEIITNAATHKEVAGNFFRLAKTAWKKEPYTVSNGLGIRAKMLSAMAREAFYLVENGFASVEDIDRACRNDAGYYLPFSGNFRYMDLMGTYAYGLVMKDLNRELSKECRMPAFLEEIIEQGGLGMENNKGFYKYEDGDAQRWNEIFLQFSHRIQHLINKYPFNNTEKTVVADRYISPL